MAERLTTILRPGDTLARMSGDEFVILCEDIGARSNVEPLAVRIGAVLAEPFALSGTDVAITASIGIAFAGPGSDVREQLLRDADAAMYQAKRKGGGRHQIIDLRERRFALDRAGLEQDLRGAADRDELRLVYQPVVSTADGRISGVEALLRWAHPTRGLLTPDIIVPLAEQAGLIPVIGRWVLERAMRDREAWDQARDCGELAMCVNVSTLQLMAPGFAATVKAVLGATRAHPGDLTLEITESVFIADAERALIVLEGLKRLGVAQNPASGVIVSAVVGMSHILGMTVVAEGVESADQHRAVEALGCDSCQGYYFARPMPAADIGTLLELRRTGGELPLPALAG